jgi:hypothetical protein
MPADDGLGLDDNQNVVPAWPEAAKHSSEQAVGRVQHRPGMFLLEHGDLLPQGKDLEGSICTTAEEDADHGEEGENEFCREFTVLTRTWRRLHDQYHQL